MDPFKMASFGSAPAAGTRLQSAINSTAPLATTYHGAQTGATIPQYQAPTTDNRSGVQKFADFLGNIKDQTGNIASTAAQWLGGQLVHASEAPLKFGRDLGNEIVDNMSLDENNAKSKMLDNMMTTLQSQYKSGKISSDSYKKGLNELSQEFDNLSNSTRAVNKRIDLNTKDTYQDGIDTAATVVTIMTGGFGKATDIALAGGKAVPVFEKTAADYLTSINANAFFGNVESAVAKIGDNPALFDSLGSATQRALQTATAEVVAQGTTMTAGQIARATVVNMALKYPLNFSALSSVGGDVYKELDQKKYGDAIQALAFNAALLLSGGPIGWALEKTGGAFKTLGKYTFGQSSFWDELGQYYQGGAKNGFATAVKEATAGMDDATRTEYIHNLSAVEATNLNAVGGNAKAAAYRLAQGMKNMYGLNLTEVSPTEELNRMVTMAKAQRLADTVGQANNLGRITVGRLDQRDLSNIAERMTEASPGARLQAWEQLKADNPTRSWANNDTFDKQMKNLISQHEDGRDLSKAIKDVTASFRVKGFPTAEAKQLSKMGYLPIQPVDLQAPFKEGSDKLLTKFSTGEGFFTKAVQPVPVLGHIGDLLVKGGLSPQTSTQRVYQLFTGNLSTNLEGSNALQSFTDRLVNERTAAEAAKAEKTVTKAVPTANSQFTKEELAAMEKQGITPELLNKGKVSGETPVQEQISEATSKAVQPKAVPVSDIEKIKTNASDVLIKKLSDFAHSPTRGGLKVGEQNIRPPIIDLRQLTTKDIMTALKATSGEAREVKSAILHSMLQVPLDVRGLGDKVMDLNYFLPGTARYARIQGAFRYAWNPVFAAKLEYKTEILSQLAAGGKFPTVLGTNTILKMVMPQRYAALDDITETLRSSGIFDTPGHLGVMTGEAVNDAGAGARNLTHKLLPGQERSIAGLVGAQADHVGMSTEDYIKNFPHEVADTVQAIAQYDRHNGFLNSPMVRTLNMAFFPFRFELKVATAVLKAAAKTDPMTQFGIINGMFRAKQFFDSPEGMAWYAHNSDVIGLMQYFTPLNTLDTVANILNTHGTDPGAYGELGGLPFGWIPQATDAAGLTHFGVSQPFIDSKTGDVIPTYVPQTDRARLQLAIEDLIGSLYTYPGATAGLPSKGSINRAITFGITGGEDKGSFSPVTPPLGPRDQAYQKAIQDSNPQANTQHQIDQLGAQHPMNPGSSVPQQSTPLTQPPVRSSSGSAKKKRASFTPDLLPGQTQLGQI